MIALSSLHFEFKLSVLQKRKKSLLITRIPEQKEQQLNADARLISNNKLAQV